MTQYSTARLELQPPTPDKVLAAAPCFNKVGPGFALVGAEGNGGRGSDVLQIMLSANRLLGRMDIFLRLVRFSPETWSLMG